MVEKNGVFNDVFLTKNDYKYNNFATTSSLSNNFFLKTLSDKKLNIFKNKILNFNVNENIMHPEFIENTR
jgi:hypothetical protein